MNDSFSSRIAYITQVVGIGDWIRIGVARTDRQSMGLEELIPLGSELAAMTPESVDQLMIWLGGCLTYLDANDQPLAAAYLSSCIDAIRNTEAEANNP